jgi:hypothetical protein
MKIWSLSDPENHYYGGAEMLGAFVPPRPKYGRGVRTNPLIIRWDGQARVAGDFTFPGIIHEVMVKRAVGEALLSAGFRDFELGPVEVRNRDGKTLRRALPERLAHEFAEILIKKIVPLEKTNSKFTTEFNRGKTYYKMPGLAHTKMENWDRKTGHMDRIFVPREKNKGFFVPEELLDGCDLFRVSEFEGRSLCTDRFRDFVLKRGYTNITFLEAGDVVST